MTHGVCELLWIRNALKDLGFKSRKPMDLHCDDKAAIQIAHNPVQHDRTKVIHRGCVAVKKGWIWAYLYI